jgi:hypothetical protein
MAQAKKKDEQQNIVDLFGEDAGMGGEDVRAQDMLIPFVTILQKLSPQLNKRKNEYIEGAEEGMILETSSGRVFEGEKAGIKVVPIKYARRYTEWVPREKGGGLIGERDESILDSCIQQEKGGYKTASGNDVVVSGNFYVLIVQDDAKPIKAIISMSASQLKKARGWVSNLQEQTITMSDGSVKDAPYYSNVYRLTTIPQENDQGSWFGWKIEREGSTLEVLPNMALQLRDMSRSFYADVKSGRAIAAPESETPQIEQSNAPLDDDIPF